MSNAQNTDDTTTDYRPFSDDTTFNVATVNVPDHKGTTTEHAEPVDYSDGYGHTYAKGE